jgi:hypothetical protein
MSVQQRIWAGIQNWKEWRGDVKSPWIEIESDFVDRNAKSAMNWTRRGITLDSNEKDENAVDSIRCNSDSDSNWYKW